MTTYMVFEPPAGRGDPAARAERIVFVPDRFSWGAFLLAPLWMLWRRLWLVFVAYFVVMAAVTLGLMVAGVGPGARFLVGALISLLVGLEAANLRRWALLRGGWRERGPIIGHDLAAAERPALIILDLGLPDRDGADVCRDLRAFTSAPIRSRSSGRFSRWSSMAIVWPSKVNERNAGSRSRRSSSRATIGTSRARYPSKRSYHSRSQCVCGTTRARQRTRRRMSATAYGAVRPEIVPMIAPAVTSRG